MWLLLESDDGWCITHEKNALHSGKLTVGSTTKYWYQGKEYMGKVLMIDGNHEKVNSVLKDMKKKKSLSQRKLDLAEPPVVPHKRKTVPVEHYGTASSTSSEQLRNKKKVPPKLSEAEKTRQRILQLNKAEAQKRANNAILARLREEKKSRRDDKDPEYNPPELEDDESQGSTMSEILSNSTAAKDGRGNLLRSLKKSEESAFFPSFQNPNVDEEMSNDGTDSHEEDLDTIFCKLNPDENQGTPEIDKDANIEKEKDDNAKEKDKDKDDNAKEKEKDSRNSKQGKDKDGEGSNSSKRGNEKQNKSNEDESWEDMDIDSEDILKEALMQQLYGAGEGMTPIGANTYCQTDVLVSAVTNAKSVATLCRRMFPGVFKVEAVQDCTVTGQSWHAGGAEKLQLKRTPLHEGALKAILAFANSLAKKKGWSIVKKYDKIKPVFANKLVEVKKKFKKCAQPGNGEEKD